MAGRGGLKGGAGRLEPRGLLGRGSCIGSLTIEAPIHQTVPPARPLPSSPWSPANTRVVNNQHPVAVPGQNIPRSWLPSVAATQQSRVAHHRAWLRWPEWRSKTSMWSPSPCRRRKPLGLFVPGSVQAPANQQSQRRAKAKSSLARSRSTHDSSP